MLSWLICTFVSVINGGEGFTTKAEREQFEKDMEAAGKTGHVTNTDPKSWEKHLAALEQPQPDEWRMRGE